jgi:tetratricopeptide (TPR) repeat protein
MDWPSHRPSAATVVLSALIIVSGCSIDKTKVLAERGTVDTPSQELAERARSMFHTRPRTATAVEAAREMMSRAARGAASDDSARYEYLTEAVRYAVWLMSRSDSLIGVLAEDAVVFCNTAIRSDSSRAPAYYYRAIAIGLIARQDKLKGRAAMRDIRDDCRTAIDIDPMLDHSGPDRVLGALYLRAPGPPAGIGSLRQAVSHLERAYSAAPHYPENALFLAEAYLQASRVAEAHTLLDAVEHLLEDSSIAEDERDRWQMRLSEVREMESATGN